MKLKTIIISLIGISLLITLGIWIQNQEKITDTNSAIQNVTKREIEDRTQNYIKSWEGKVLPTLEVLDTSGNTLSLSSDSKQYTIYIVWASWCPDCQRGLPIINRVYADYKEKARFISIALINFRGETFDSAKTFYNKHQLNLPVFFDKDNMVYHSLNIKAIPTIYIVNQDGIIEKVIIESTEKSELLSLLEEIS